MQKRQCAFLTLAEAGDFVIDDEVAVPALEARDWTVHTIPWNRRAVDWRAYELVIVRSTWDYWDHVSEFLDVLQQIDEATQLANPLPLMRWNLSKSYLRDLEAQGVDIVPTQWVAALDDEVLQQASGRFGAGAWVLKPQVGANGIDAYRFPGADEAAVLGRLAGRPVMIQPFCHSVPVIGEYSLFYFAGRFSHAICKRPAAGEFRSQEERGATISAVRAEVDLLELGSSALEALAQTPLYARVDMVRLDSGKPAIMELELIEPSLYFRMDARAPEAFAVAVERQLLPTNQVPE